MEFISARNRRRIARAIGVEPADPNRDRDFDDEFRRLFARVRPFTMTTPERLFGLREAIEYVVREEIPGDAVECGVWRGGSSMAIALRLLALGDEQRELWMFDTFDGMPAPSADDGAYVRERFDQYQARGDKWDFAPLDDVARNLRSTGFPVQRLHLVQGKVEDTVPAHGPETIALLRLDTDWYESTKHELECFWDRLSPGGVLIIDDYGHWEGARKAVDEFFERRGSRPLFSRLDYTGRLVVKPAASS